MLFRKCRSQRGHRIGKARLMHGNDIHITLTEQHILLSGGSRIIQSIQVAALVKQLRLRGIQILWLTVTDDSSSEAYDFSRSIKDRKNHPAPEFVKIFTF